MLFKEFFSGYIHKNESYFRGQRVIDMPAGCGDTSHILMQIGAEVRPYDLFPEYFLHPEIKCSRADISDGIPEENASADVIICQEGIEHFSDQFHALKEFNRVLKKNGLLIITTPNYSNLRSRLSYMLNETERFGSMMPPNEIDSVWMADKQISNEIYCGHIFLIGIQKLRVLAKLAGFRIDRIVHTNTKPTSVLLFPFLYPLIIANACFSYAKNIRKRSNIPLETRKKVYKEVFKLSVNPRLLTDGNLFVEFRKEMNSGEVINTLRGETRPFGDPT